MSLVGLMSKPVSQLKTRTGVVSTDRVPVFTVEGTEPEMVSIELLAGGGIDQETITSAGALSDKIEISKLELVGAGAVSLGIPDASMLGKIKVIEMNVDNGDVTLPLTNIQGGSAATTCTWANVGEALVLVGGIAKWNVVSEGGVVLS